MSKPHLILVPGLLCDHSAWEHQARDLQDLSDITIVDHGSLDSLHAMAEAILENAPRYFALAGHSMGGRVAFQVFRRAPERITGIALLDTASTSRQAGIQGEQEALERYRLLEKARKDGMRAMGADWVQRMVHPDRLSDAQLMNSILDMVARKTPEMYAAQIKALLDRPDVKALLPQIQCPTLLLCGRQDSWSGLSHHEEMASMIPNSSLAVVENCGHMSTMERPAEVTAAMRNWLGRVV
jgi:pimeloyl-ACP methyl ester carboxylesterase